MPEVLRTACRLCSVSKQKRRALSVGLASLFLLQGRHLSLRNWSWRWDAGPLPVRMSVRYLIYSDFLGQQSDSSPDPKQRKYQRWLLELCIRLAEHILSTLVPSSL